MKLPQWMKKAILVVAGAVVGVLVSMKILRARRRPVLITQRTVNKYYKSGT